VGGYLSSPFLLNSMTHKLSLEVPTVLNTCILKIFDTSVYADLLPVTCPTIQITVPGFNLPENIPFTPGSSPVITACILGLQINDCATELYPIPDGIYIIRYSVSPNETVYVEYNHLRISKALTRYTSILCDLELAACEPSAKIKKKLDKLIEIKSYLDAAKAKVEYCHEPDKGMTLYNYAIKLLDKLECKTC
jgi:hypothetical protein